MRGSCAGPPLVSLEPPLETPSTDSLDNQTSPMHTHQDHSSLCLISTLSSLSSSLSMLHASASMPSCSRRDNLITTLLLTLTRSCMTTGGAGGGGGEVQGPGESPVPPSRGSFSPHPVSLNFRCHLLIRGEVEEDACTQHVW